MALRHNANVQPVAAVDIDFKLTADPRLGCNILLSGFVMFSSDSEIIRHALIMWRNYIQTGDVVLSTVDACNIGQEKLCRQLNADQQEFVTRLEELAASQSR